MKNQEADRHRAVQCFREQSSKAESIRLSCRVIAVLNTALPVQLLHHFLTGHETALRSQASPQSSRRIITPVIDSIIGRQQNYHLHCITGQMQWWGWGEFCWLLLVPDPKMLDS